MAAFIVRFADEQTGSFQGRVRHVASGEESAFTDVESLLAFFERMNVLDALTRTHEELVEAHCADRPKDAPPRAEAPMEEKASREDALVPQASPGKRGARRGT